MGGAEQVLEAAKIAYDKGEYRWVAELLNHLVFAEPNNKAAKQLLAQTYQQLGYQAEASTWRNSYLTAAQELQQGAPEQGVERKYLLGLMQRTPTPRFLEAMAASLNGPAAAGKNYVIQLQITDLNENYILWLENSVLHYQSGITSMKPDASLRITKLLLVKLLAGAAGLTDIMASDEFALDGSRIDFVNFMRLIDKASANFAIVTAE
jgi:alkyl sulfatase BDS1-like metallo-beta-lactamase superfamily hydrolase